MLSTETPVARPRPPAQMRRSHSAAVKSGSSSSPPPPYASSFVFPSQSKSRQSPMDTLLGSPVSATYRRIEREVSSPRLSLASVSGDDMDWLHERSREELSSLLVKADGVIRQRETELDRASSVVKSLYDDNLSLKTKHSSFFARFPRSNTASPSPSHSQMSSVESPHMYSSSMSRPSSSNTTFRHVRRISIRPDDLALLSDQNAELIQKLEKLESESASAELSGRRMLKQLEKEIQALRTDLEKTQAKSQEYEDQAKRMKPLEAALKRQVERDDRHPVMHDSEEEDHDEQVIKDFAPGGPLSRSPTRVFPKSASMPNTAFSSSKETTPQMQLHSDLAAVPFPTTAESDSGVEVQGAESAIPNAVSEPELALISQLIAKIQELEDTNAQILEQQAQNTNKLMAMQRETECMTRVYDAFNDPDTEFVEEDAIDDSEDMPALNGRNADTTIRFRSFRKTLEGGSRPPDLDGLYLSSSAPQKPRKSVMDLFGAPSQAVNKPSRKPKGLSIPFASASPFHRHSTSGEHDGVISPTLSSVHFSASSTCSTPPQELSPSPFYPGTLQNELGDDWNLNAPLHHLRNTSLYSLSEYSAPPSPSPVPSSPDPVPQSFRSLFATEMEAYHQENGSGFKTPLTKTNGLQLTLEPPTPDNAIDDASPSIGSPTPSTPSLVNYERQRRMSQTVRSRTHRWVNGRFTESVLAPSVKRKGRDPEESTTPVGGRASTSELPAINVDSDVPSATEGDGSEEGNRTPRGKRRGKSLLVVLAQPVVPQRLSDAFESVVEKFQGHQRSTSTSSSPVTKEEAADVLPGADNSMEVFVDRSQVTQHHNQQGLSKVMVEVWMWLQFGIIILVFLWAMARKGPKSVLGEVSGKRSNVSRRR